MTDAGRPGDGEEVGSLGVEAARLLAAVQQWAAHSGGEYAGAATSAAAGMAGLLHDVDQHVATGATECTYCPVCRVVSTVRGTSPEVRAELRAAATSLLRAAAGMIATAVPSEHATRPGTPDEDDRGAGAGDRIEVGDEWEDD